MQGRTAVLILDLKKSKSYPHEIRTRIQYMLVNVIGSLNKLFCRCLLRKVEFSAGDEIQGLFSSPDAAYLYYRLLTMWLHPIKTRAGIGVGDWDVRIEEMGTTSQDGQVYHFARYAIENAEDGEGYPVLLYSGKKADPVINTIIGAEASVRAKQSVYQNHIALLTEVFSPIRLTMGDDLIFPQGIDSLLREKSNFDHYIGKINKPLPLDQFRMEAAAYWPYDSNPVYALLPKEPSFYISSGRQRGVPTAIANMVGASRQTIEKAIKSGNIFTARNMAITAAEQMARSL